MSGRSFTGIARQSIGVALSRDLLAALSSCPAEAGIGYPAHRDEPTRDDKRPTGQRLSSTGLTPDCTGSTVQSQPASSTQFKFRIYSLFGDTVPSTSLHGSTEANGHSRMSTEGDDKPDETSANPSGLIEVLTDAVRRRSWLLAKALEAHPLDEALELARTAEAFITGSSTLAEATAIPPHLDNRTDRTSARDTERLKKRTPLTVPPEQREQLLQRLAHGARNAEVASEFGLSMKQVQGIRMGSAREITRIRDRARDHR
jgi:hypothetical protein